MQSETPAPTHPVDHKEGLCSTQMHTRTHTHAFASPTHTFIEWGSDSECKRPHWYIGQSCLWHQCCWCYCPPREGTITGPHPACVYTLPYEWALCLQLCSRGKWLLLQRRRPNRINVFTTFISFMFFKINSRCGRASSPRPTQGCRLPDRLSPASPPPPRDHSHSRVPSWCSPLLQHLLLSHHAPLPVPQWPRYWRRRGVTEPEQQLWAPVGGRQWHIWGLPRRWRDS